jgi:hypothetical protein
VDLQVSGEEGIFLLDIEREQLEVRRHDGRRAGVDLSPGEGVYSLEEQPHGFVDQFSGRGTNNSPDDLAACVVELIEVMRIAANVGSSVVLPLAFVKGATGNSRQRSVVYVDDIDD